jgi:Phage tail assembly chaperone protein
MIYLFDNDGRCVLRTFIHYDKIEHAENDILLLMQSFNVSKYIESESTFDIKKIRLNGDAIELHPESPGDDYVFNYKLNEWEIDKVEVYNREKQKSIKLLKESDYTQLPDMQEEMSGQEKKAWKDYRSQLRAFPSNYEGLSSYTWPVKPT